VSFAPSPLAGLEREPWNLRSSARTHCEPLQSHLPVLCGRYAMRTLKQTKIFYNFGWPIEYRLTYQRRRNERGYVEHRLRAVEHLSRPCVNTWKATSKLNWISILENCLFTALKSLCAVFHLSQPNASFNSGGIPGICRGLEEAVSRQTFQRANIRVLGDLDMHSPGPQSSLSGRVVDGSGRRMRLALSRPLPLGSAVQVYWDNHVALGEICCSGRLGSDHGATLEVEHFVRDVDSLRRQPAEVGVVCRARHALKSLRLAWSCRKAHEVRNACPKDLWATQPRRPPHLIVAFWKQASLFD
jgi:hypothetical protein